MTSYLIFNCFQWYDRRVQLVHFHVLVRIMVYAQALALKYVHVLMVLLVVFVNNYYVNIIFLKRNLSI